MERYVITINRQGSVSIPCKDVWMNEMELVELFDVIAPHSVLPSEPCTRAEC